MSRLAELRAKYNLEGGKVDHSLSDFDGDSLAKTTKKLLTEMSGDVTTNNQDCREDRQRANIEKDSDSLFASEAIRFYVRHNTSVYTVAACDFELTKQRCSATRCVTHYYCYG